jgi:hypothetical protein
MRWRGCFILVGEILIRGYSIGYLPWLGLVGLAIILPREGRWCDPFNSLDLQSLNQDHD